MLLLELNEKNNCGQSAFAQGQALSALWWTSPLASLPCSLWPVHLCTWFPLPGLLLFPTSSAGMAHTHLGLQFSNGLPFLSLILTKSGEGSL
jgi:hypothetical protein